MPSIYWTNHGSLSYLMQIMDRLTCLTKLDLLQEDVINMNVGALRRAQANVTDQRITLPPSPVGSPYGFTEEDWETLSTRKQDSDRIYIVFDLQFKSEYYDSDLLRKNVESMFFNALNVYKRESFDKPQMNQIINHILQLKQRHHITRVYVDGSNPEVIRELKRRIGEPENIQQYYTEEQIWHMRYGDNMQIIPTNFQKRHREMLQWSYTLMSKRLIRIYPSLQKLIISLRTAVVIDDWKLDKQQTSHDDILDSFRLALCNYDPPKNL